jgi:hypothetical protein
MERRTRGGLIAAGGAAAAAAVVAVASDGGEGGAGSGSGGSAHSRVVPRGATSRTTDRFGLGDVGIANFLLTLQWIELDVYAHAPPRFRDFAEQERLHAARLERAVRDLGTHIVRRRRARLSGIGADTFVKYALTVEDLAAAACLGQLAAIDTPELLRVVLSIHTVDARHAAVFAELSDLDPVPDGARARPLDAATVLARLRPLLR